MNLLAAEIFLLIILLVMWLTTRFNDSGCGGTCEQGRKPCDCGRKKYENH